MAGVSSNSKKHSFDIVFDGALLSSTRASLVIELINYLLYERQQIPLPLEQLKSQILRPVNQTCSTSTTTALEKKEHKTHQGTFTKNQSERKAKCLISDLTLIFENLKKAFELCPEIEQVVIILGGTLFSPKESFLINFPPPCPDADCLPLLTCKQTLFRQIIGEDILGCLSSTLSPTNMMLLVSAPRSCPLQWFLPRQSFSSPKSGQVMSFNFHCKYLVPICHDLTFVEGEVDISGIELLECSLCEKENKNEMAPGEQSEEGSEASCIEDKDFTVASLLKKHCSLEMDVSSEVSPTQDVSVGASPCVNMPRFCAHQRLNYIYSHRKKKNGNGFLHWSPLQSHINHGKTILNLMTASPVLNMGANSPSLPGPAADKDLLWYQSPLVIKGYKETSFAQNNFSALS